MNDAKERIGKKGVSPLSMMRFDAESSSDLPTFDLKIRLQEGLTRL
jgi:hypothetical protein